MHVSFIRIVILCEGDIFTYLASCLLRSWQVELPSTPASASVSVYRTMHKYVNKGVHARFYFGSAFEYFTR
jgi:hypothetical protein